MATTAESSGTSPLERNWWLRAPAVLVAPRAVFASLRDDSVEAADERGQPIVAIIGLAGMAAVLATPTAHAVLNEGASAVIIPIWVFLGGSTYAFAAYWLGGGLLFGASRRLGGLGNYRRARHLFALASAPVALSLFTLWPLRIAIYGEDLFRTWRADLGVGDEIFGALFLAAVCWSALLVVLGVRVVHSWSWARSGAAVGLAASLPVLLVIATRMAH